MDRQDKARDLRWLPGTSRAHGAVLGCGPASVLCLTPEEEPHPICAGSLVLRGRSCLGDTRSGGPWASCPAAHSPGRKGSSPTEALEPMPFRQQQRRVYGPPSILCPARPKADPNGRDWLEQFRPTSCVSVDGHHSRCHLKRLRSLALCRGGSSLFALLLAPHPEKEFGEPSGCNRAHPLAINDHTACSGPPWYARTYGNKELGVIVDRKYWLQFWFDISEYKLPPG